MNTWKNLTTPFQAVLVWFAVCAAGYCQTTSRLSTSFLARGEQALLEVSVVGGQPDEMPEIPGIDDVKVEPSGSGPTRMAPGRRLEWVFEYIVASYAVGKHIIPGIDVTVDGVTTTTEPIELEVFNPDELSWSEVESSGKVIRYASMFRTMAASPFENQTTPAEIKLFVPEEIFVDDWGIPDFERDGLTSWRFQPSLMKSRINLLGRPYISVAYPSTITPTRSGKVGIGPADIRLVTREVIQNPFPQQVNKEIHVTVPRLEVEARPVPAGAPEGYRNAVGSFRIAASTSQTEVQEGDPISVDLIVSGSGNLDTIQPPELANADGWKIYGTTPQQRGDERRQLSGSTVFHQLIRPSEMKTEIPSFRLVYFDPKTESFRTLLTEPIALRMQPSTAPTTAASAVVQALPVPFERMTDILGLLRTSQLTVPSAALLPSWLGHAIGVLLALALAFKAFWMRHAPSLKKNPDREAKIKALREVEQSKSAGDTEFLRTAGGFIETWAGADTTPEIQAILTERDAMCFRAEKPKAVIDQKRRSEILKVLRKAAAICIFLTTLGLSAPARADTATHASEAYDSAKYDEAIKLWLGAGDYEKLSADTLYNIGNACYRSGSPGQAALFYRRALSRDSGHEEARQNLRFLERKYGAITVQRQEFQYAISKFSLPMWKSVCWGGLWLCVLALLVFPATRPDARLRVAAVVALVIGPILLAAGALGWRYFPTDSEFAPLSQQAVVISDKVALHTDAARTAPEVIDAPPGSLCQIITLSGRWAYVAFATKTRGWVPVESIERVAPDKAPEPPKFSKPTADGKTA